MCVYRDKMRQEFLHQYQDQYQSQYQYQYQYQYGTQHQYHGTLSGREVCRRDSFT